MFFWNYLAFSMIQQMLAIWPLIPLPCLNPGGTYGSSWFMDCWSLSWRVLSITLLACEMSTNYGSVKIVCHWPFFGIGMKTNLFQSFGHCWFFQICWLIECYTLTASSFRIYNSSAGIPCRILAYKTSFAFQGRIQ